MGIATEFVTEVVVPTIDFPDDFPEDYETKWKPNGIPEGSTSGSGYGILESTDDEDMLKGSVLFFGDIFEQTFRRMKRGKLGSTLFSTSQTLSLSY